MNDGTLVPVRAHDDLVEALKRALREKLSLGVTGRDWGPKSDIEEESGEMSESGESEWESGSEGSGALGSSEASDDEEAETPARC